MSGDGGMVPGKHNVLHSPSVALVPATLAAASNGWIPESMYRLLNLVSVEM